MVRVLVSSFIALLILTGCTHSKVITSEYSTHNPTAHEILIQNRDADIFQFEDIIYQNASNNEWVQQVELTIGDHVVTIKKEYKDGITFEEGMATKLPIGTEIYEPFIRSGPILIVKLNDKEIRYLGLIEG